MNRVFTTALICYFLFTTIVATAEPADLPPSCPCTGDNFVEIELLYLGADDATVEVYKDDEYIASNLLLTFADVDSGETITLDADDATNLPGDNFLFRTYLRITVDGEVSTVDFYSTCPSQAYQPPLEDHLILGKTFGDFTVTSHTDDNGTVCSINDADANLSWLVGGNIVGSENNLLGSVNSEPVTLITSNTARGIITDDGRFGFGTTSPASNAMVEVDGNLTVDGDTDISGSDNDGTTAALRVESSGQTMLLDGNEIDAISNPLRLNNNSNHNVIIANGGGNVGVGTVASDSRLRVRGSDNDGTTATVQIQSGSQTMLLDGNEIDAIANNLLINSNSSRNVVIATGGGNVGIGGNPSDSRLRIRGPENDGTIASLHIQSGSQRLLLDGNEIDATANNLHLNNNSTRDVILANGGGNVGIGIIASDARLHVDGDLRLQSPNNNTFLMAVDNNGDFNFVGDGNRDLVRIDDANGNTRFLDPDANATVIIRPRDAAAEIGGEIRLMSGAGLANTIELDANWANTGRGRIRTDELEIEGGADISEQFAVSGINVDLQPTEGMLVSIAADQPGELKITTEAYDKKVAGVISGANGIRTGLYLGQKDSEADGEYPVALMGRVYLLADASFGPIEAGDLLTSSSVPGYAMKVSDYEKAKGAIIGKAMSGLEEGQGYVLILVSLQ